MKKLWFIFISFLMCFVLFQTTAEFEALPVEDRAAVFSSQTQNDAVKLSKLIKEKTGLNLEIHARHFLGGADPDTNARRLLMESADQQNTILLLMVIGEESYAVASGANAQKLIGPELCDTLLSKNFRGDFLKRDYDRAVAGFMLSVTDELTKQTGEKIRLEGLFTNIIKNTASPLNTQPPESKWTNIFDFNSFLREPVSATSDPARRSNRTGNEDRGLSIGSIIIIGLVLSSIFGKDKKGRRKGCGCGPLGWIFGVFGISKFFGWRK